MKKVILYWAIPFSWIGVIFFFSSQSSSEQDVKPFLSRFHFIEKLEPLLSKIQFSYYGEVRSVEVMGLERFIEFLIRKLAHFGVYFILAVLIFIAVQKTLRATMQIKLMFTFYIVVLFAIMDELNQAFTPERTPYYYDVAIDAFGALTALLCVVVYKFLFKKNGVREVKI
ncbi:VanZ family protein [Bacillaceae bacterium W0354]